MKRLKRAFIACFFAVAVLCAAFLPACGITEYDRQKNAIKKVAVEEKYSFVTGDYINGNDIEKTVRNFVKRTRKSNTIFVYGFLRGDRYYFLGRYYSTHKDEDYDGDEHYMNYLLGYISCPSGKVTALKWLVNLPVEYSYSYPCNLRSLGNDLALTVGSKIYKVSVENAAVSDPEIEIPHDGCVYSSQCLIFYAEQSETKTYTALNRDFQKASFAVDGNYVLKSCRGNFAFFGDESESPLKAFNYNTGEKYTGDIGKLYEGLSSPEPAATVTADGVEYAVELKDGGVSFTDGKTVLQVTDDDISRTVAAMSEIEEIYGKKFHIRQVFGQDGEVFLRLDNPREYDMVVLPNIFGFGVEYTVSIIIKYEIATGTLKYAGYAPGTSTLLKVYKN